MEPIRGDVLRGHLETMILSALEHGDAHGFEVLRRLEEAGCGALRLKEGSLYPALYRLEGSGQIRGAWEDGASDRRGPRRHVMPPAGPPHPAASRPFPLDPATARGNMGTCGALPPAARRGPCNPGRGVGAACGGPNY